MKSEQVAGFVSESMAGFIGIRTAADVIVNATRDHAIKRCEKSLPRWRVLIRDAVAQKHGQ